MKVSGIVTLTTDFGTADGYVGAVKGVIHSIHPKVRLVDLTNEIPSFDIVVGAFHLGGAFSYYPRGTVHLAVVDPGVGGSRRPILVTTKNFYFVGPDNGLFTLAVRKDPVVSIHELTEKKYFRSEMSSTFHGRDLFGPVAAHLSRGVLSQKLGIRRKEMTLLPDFEIRKEKEGWGGTILFFDKFGNGFTSVQQSHLSSRPSSVIWHRQEIPFYRTYSEIPLGEPGALFGSSGFLEIALREDSFQERCNASRGEEILLKKK